MNAEQWLNEIGRFADIDVPVESALDSTRWIARFRQQGLEVELTYSVSDGRISERRGVERNQYGSHRGLLASQHFGNLSLLARLQRSTIAGDLGHSGASCRTDIPIIGEIVSGEALVETGSLLDRIDAWTNRQSSKTGVRALVIDGPAGIGKTHLIRSLVWRRADSFGPNGNPLILHVQSRGRQLTTLPDLLAGTLQSLRLALTYEQVPVLARHGLLHVAIDGFDELADPSGYETAWHSLNDFVADINMGGVLLLAGRDTFIDAESVRQALPRLHAGDVGAVHLRPPLPAEAIKWLTDQAVAKDKVDFLEKSGLLDEGTYSLRPFFLRQLQSIVDDCGAEELLASSPLRTLIEAMIRREAPLAAKLAPGLGSAQLGELLRLFFREVARDMADYESESIDVPSLQLIAEIVFGKVVKDDSLRAIRNRVKSIALLDVDSVADRRVFVHTEVQDFFLAQAYIDLLSQDDPEIPRSLRRNILGSDFLETFHDVSLTSDGAKLLRFQERAVTIIQAGRYEDRSLANISAMLLASSDATNSATRDIKIEDVSIDECVLRGIVGIATLKRLSISQLDARGADVSKISFEDVVLISLIVDEATVLPNTVPNPRTLVVDMQGKRTRLFDPSHIERQLDILRSKDVASSRIGQLGDLGRLLDKLCRTVLRQAWIRQTEDDRAGRLLDDPDWPELRALLERHGLLEERENKPASGKNSKFIRIRMARELLDPKAAARPIVALRQDLSTADGK